ncbi:MAG TPA: hypothetical protein VHZ97_22630 [Pseudonocardiaceae bacterium]|jgi:hypothetical protein|nr:hypothetical protein [Pseudonocardiaceae bacterium]
MRRGWLLKVAGLYFGALGAASLLVPTMAAASLGQVMTPFDVFTARTIGAILLAVAIMNWSASRQSPAAPRGVLLGNIFLNAALAVVDIVGVAGGTIGAGSWSGIAIHLLLLSGFLYYAIRAPLAVTV